MNMKKITQLMAMAAIVAMPFALTSCDDDDYWYDDPWWYTYDNDGWRWDDNYYHGDDNTSQGTTLVDEAQVLNGEWEGQMIYQNATDGTTDQFYANMTFVQNSTTAIRGTGTEYDYYLNSDGSVANSQRLKFTWYIDNNGDIYVKYESGFTFVMDQSASAHGFYLDEQAGVFRGYMIGTNSNDLIQFDFTRQTSNAKSSAATRSVSPATTVFGKDVIGRIATTGTMSLPKR